MTFKVGDWSSENQVKFMQNYSKTVEEFVKANLKNRTLIVTTLMGRPYLGYVDDYEKKGLTGNDIYEGYNVDLISAIAKRLEFKYIIKPVGDSAYGKMDEKGEWNGMIRELIDGVSKLTISFCLNCFFFILLNLYFLFCRKLILQSLI